VASPDGVPAPGEAVTLKLTVTNVGSVAGKAKARFDGRGQIFSLPTPSRARCWRQGPRRP
jgi:hypothetical protein